MYGCVFVPAKLTARLNQLGWDVDDLADRSGLNERNLRRIIDGDRPTPYSTTLARIAAAVDCDIEDLTEPVRVFVPTKLTMARARAGLTLRALAAKAGVSERELWRLEHGQRPTPFDVTLTKLAAALDCSVDDLTTAPDRQVAA